ncbi:NADP-dependent oxidoreductase [Stigmatella aurantiaca]|uniref:Alcohol dehydrogenase superfamily protein n=1 Tax=Stigmatella aurantiaca (strain DW4/3-1) TaxID=378806 RepID=Q09C78_STIAD|nr:NADP-dependent oxidoreductase [Stigmatella aurantiaca]ADO74332.1 Alcohol dehydrogenase superfamily protein [Stigmatella aurantiaca DW4/3-1]EAU69307.1 NADPH [Stigmatella aurantiaca DW4/3-1]
MQVIEVTRFGGPDVLHLAERPEPQPTPDEVVVRVAAANVNPTDLGARMGQIPGAGPQPPFVLGWDLAGTVTAVGKNVRDLKTGQRVVGMIPWYTTQGTVGAYATSVAIRAEWLVPLPEGFDEALAATVPLNALTAQQALGLLQLPARASLLITGASGAVGSFAVQLAVRAGHRVAALAGRDDEEWVRSLGAEEVLSRSTDLSRIEPRPFVLDAVPLGEAALQAVRDGGAVVTTRPVPVAPAERHIRQEAVLIRADRAALESLVRDVARGVLKTRVARVLPLAQAAEAHRRAEAGGLHGKIVLAP